MPFLFYGVALFGIMCSIMVTVALKKDIKKWEKLQTGATQGIGTPSR